MAYMTRRAARECAVKLLYSCDFHKKVDLTSYFDFTCGEFEIETNDYAKKVFLGTCENIDKINETISKYSRGWKVGRIAHISMAIMRICVYEMLFLDDVPDAVAINEAIELAKLYDSNEAPAFINGILNSVSKSKAMEDKPAIESPATEEDSETK